MLHSGLRVCILGQDSGLQFLRTFLLFHVLVGLVSGCMRVGFLTELQCGETPDRAHI